MLTSLQLSRIKFHLGISDNRRNDGYLEVVEELTLNSLTPEQELQLIGSPLELNQTLLHGEVIAYGNSLLAKVEAAWQRIDASVIDTTLFVKSAGAVTLRADELQARRRLYDELRLSLAELLDWDGFTNQYKGPSYGY